MSVNAFRHNSLKNILWRIKTWKEKKKAHTQKKEKPNKKKKAKTSGHYTHLLNQPICIIYQIFEYVSKAETFANKGIYTTIASQKVSLFIS